MAAISPGDFHYIHQGVCAIGEVVRIYYIYVCMYVKMGNHIVMYWLSYRVIGSKNFYKIFWNES